LIKDVHVKEIKAQSFTVYVTTVEPAKIQVSAGIPSNVFGRAGYTVVELQPGRGSEFKTDHRMAVRVVRVGSDAGGTLPPGATMKMFVNAITEDGRGFSYEGDFVVPPPE
jgi:hypothetical protein